MNQIRQAEKDNAEAQAKLLQDSISATADTIATVFGGEGLDMDFMGQQVGEIVKEINKGEGMNKEALGAMISEFDDQGLGVKIEDLIQQFDPSITGDKLAGVLKDVLQSGMTASTAAGKKLTGVMNNAVEGSTGGFLKDKGIDVSVGMGKLETEASSLADQLAITKRNMGALFANEDTKNLAREMKTMFEKMQTASASLDTFKPLMDTQAKETKQVADLIDKNTDVLVEANKTVDEAKSMIADARAEIAKARGE